MLCSNKNRQTPRIKTAKVIKRQNLSQQHHRHISLGPLSPSNDTPIIVPIKNQRYDSSASTTSSSAENDHLAQKNPLKTHSDAFEDLPSSPFPEDLGFSHRQYTRDCTDTIIKVRRAGAEPWSYSHQILGMHSLSPEHFGDDMRVVVRPARLVLDGTMGIEALSLLDHAQAMPDELSPQLSKIKQILRETNMTATTLEEKLQVLTQYKNALKTTLPTTLHLNSLITHTANGQQYDINLTNTLYADEIAYAKQSALDKGIGLWDLESGSADSIIGHNYVLPGQLIATTSSLQLGHVAAMGGISMKVSPIEAAGLITGQPVIHHHPHNPIRFHFTGKLPQWCSINEVTAIMIQYLGETAFNHPYGLKQPISIEIDDKGNQFSIDELAQLCTTIGSLPQVQTITCLPNATQYQHLRDTHRGTYNRLIYEYAPLLLEPDHRVTYKDTIYLQLSKLIPNVTVHNASATSSLNSVSCPIDYVSVVTGISKQRVNMTKFIHIDNVAIHPALEIESYHGDKAFTVHHDDSLLKDKKVLENRYKYFDPDGVTKKKSLIDNLFGRSSKLDAKSLFQKKGEKDGDTTALEAIGKQQQIEFMDNKIQQHKAMNKATADANLPTHVQHAQQIQSNSHELRNKKNYPDPKKDRTNQYGEQQLQQFEQMMNFHGDLLSKANETASHAVSNKAKHKPQPQNQQESNGMMWPSEPDVILVRGGFAQLHAALSIALQCVEEKMTITRHVYIQPESKQVYNLLANDPTLCDVHGIHIFELLGIMERPQQIGEAKIETANKHKITLLSPGSANVSDFILAKHVLEGSDGNESQPIILSTDLNIVQHHGGIQHYTPYIFTASHEFTMFVAFSGNIAHDPINHTISPKSAKYDPNDQNSFFVLPRTGVDPVIDPQTGRLRVSTDLCAFDYNLNRGNTKNNHNFHHRQAERATTNETLVLSPNNSLPSSLLKTRFDQPYRPDVMFNVYNSRYKEQHPINNFANLWSIENVLSTKEIDYNNQDMNMMSFVVNRKLLSPSQQGYIENEDIVADSSRDKTKITKTTKTYLQLSQHEKNSTTSPLIDQGIVPQTLKDNALTLNEWWDNDNLVSLPVLLNANIPTSSNDISGLDSNLKLSSYQHTVVAKRFTQFLADKLNNKLSQTGFPIELNENYNGKLMYNMIMKRLQSTPRQLLSLFPFNNNNMMYRYGLSNLKSTTRGVTAARNEYVQVSNSTLAVTPADQINNNGVKIGLKAKQRLITNTRNNFKLKIIATPDTQNSHNNKINQDVVENYLSSMTNNMLWMGTADCGNNVSMNGPPPDKQQYHHDYIDNLMPSIQTLLKMPLGRYNISTSLPSAANPASGGKASTIVSNSTHHGPILPTNQTNTSQQANYPIQYVALNYLNNGRKWALIGDGGRNANITAETTDQTRRWDQIGFGYGTIDECDLAAKNLSLLGCGAVLATKLNTTFLRALQSHGVPAFALDSPTAFSMISHNDTVSVMTHYDEQLGDESTKDMAADNKGQLFLPYQAPTIVHHINENNPINANKLGANAPVPVTSSLLPAYSQYDPHALLWFRAGNVVNAGVEDQLRKNFIDPLLSTGRYFYPIENVIGDTTNITSH